MNDDKPKHERWRTDNMNIKINHFRISELESTPGEMTSRTPKILSEN